MALSNDFMNEQFSYLSQTSDVRRDMEILLVEDNPGDARLLREAWRDSGVANSIIVVPDGEQALAYLRREGRYADAMRPDLILLDLNLPRVGGREVLRAVKNDPELRRIPVVVMTTSHAEADILSSYNLHANCYIPKPVDLDEFITVMRAVEEFWLRIVKLPSS